MRHSQPLRVALLALGVALLGIVWIRAPDERSPKPPVLRVAQASSLDSLIAAGEPLYWDGDFEGARNLWRGALDRAVANEDSIARARVLTWLGLAAFRLGEYGEARELGERALALKQRLGLMADLPRSYNALGLLALAQGRLVDAADLFGKTSEAARAVGDQESLAKAANNLGLVQSDLGEFEKARAGFLESVQAGRALNDPLIEGRALSNLGMLEARLGDPLTAVSWFQRARGSYLESGDVTGEQHTLGQLGVAYAALGEPRKAIAALDSALALARAHGLRQEEASDLELIGEFHADAGDHRRALAFYEQAGRINAELDLTIEAGVDLRRQAEAHAALGDAEEAKALAEEALAVHRSAEANIESLDDLLVLIDLDQDPKSYERHLAEARTLARRLDSRTARLNLALVEAAVDERTGQSLRALATLEAAEKDLLQGDYRTLFQFEGMRARAHARIGDLGEAATAGRRAVEAVERIRTAYASGFLRTTFVEDQRAIYADLVDILVRMGQPEEAFEVVDAARARSLLEHLSVGRAPPTVGGRTAGLPLTRTAREGEQLLHQIQGLIESLEGLESISPEERDPSHGETLDGVARRLQAMRAEYESLLVRSDEAAPRVTAILGGKHTRARTIQAALAPDEALLQYLVGPEQLWIFLMRREGVSVFRQEERPSTLARRVRLARELSGSRDPSGPAPATALESLYATLLEPVVRSGGLTDIDRLIVVPHDVLTYLPFAALRDPETGSYLVERFTLLSVPSAAALPALREDGQMAAGDIRPIVLVPFPETLPGSRAEGAALRRMLQPPTVVEGRRATETAARKAFLSGGIVHLATHGFLNPRNPLFSRIDLAPAGRERPDLDGRLELHELLDLRVRSPLVFLSGCETAAGESWSTGFARGEDYATLTRALHYAGARNVIATLWRIDDQGAAVFASRFYDHLRSHTAVEALALAQREMIRSREYSRPYYWASYRLSGSGNFRVRSQS